MTVEAAKEIYTKEDVASRCEVNEVTEVSPEKAARIAAMFEAALGDGGVHSPGHEPYPDPSLFYADGVEETVLCPERRLFIAELDGNVVGAIIADSLHQFACEFNCMAVDRTYRGLGIGSLIVARAKQIIDQCFFLSNITEMVTHSLASQIAHIQNGYDRIVGFGYSHYPNVFFADRPESVLWGGQLHGRLAEELLRLRPRFNETTTVEVLSKESQLIGKADDSQKALALALFNPRTVYLPDSYVALGCEILAQYRSQLQYRINDYAIVEDASRASYSLVAEKKSPVSNFASEKSNRFDVDFKPDYAHTYIDFASGFDVEENGEQLALEIAKIKKTPGKRFIRATIKANHVSAIAIAEFLRKHDFVFHSILPLYQYECSENGIEHRFHDLLGMQWIAEETASSNPLPGETESVIKVYGFPLGVQGRIIKTIRSELGA